MIPEIHRSLPPRVFGPAIKRYAELSPIPPRAIRKYGKPRPGDVVLDVGAYIGEFAIPASVWADKVIAVEPSPAIYKRLVAGRIGMANILPMHFAAWNDNGFALLNLADETADTHVIPGQNPQAPGETVNDGLTIVERRRLSDLPGISEVTYLKLDAEGYEPEVLDGLHPHKPQRVAVDVSPERDGESTEQEVIRWMHRNGYENVDRRPYDVVTGEL